jgi:membrane associated rhomboid family serine protease
VNQPSEPIFNVPAVLVATIAVLAIIHAARVYLLTPDQDVEVLLRFAFIPARYQAVTTDVFPGGLAADVWTFVTYALLHGDATHLIVNCIWMLPFGAAVARRFGMLRFLLLFAATAACGAAAHLFTHPQAPYPMVGASAAISGFMGASARFAFQRGGPLESWRRQDPESYKIPAQPLLIALRDPRVVIFLAAWFGINAVFGVTGAALPGEEQDVAWQAHVGGFLAGLLLFPAFDAGTRWRGPGSHPEREARDIAPQ